jgi:putative Mn2+ efflux pump MntP
VNIFEIIIIAVGLAMDAFAVSMVASASGYAAHPRPIFRLAFHFGLFQFFMPIIGWGIGITMVGYLSHIDHWLAFGLLAFVGGRMVLSGLNPDNNSLKKDPSKGLTLVMLSFATSIDALAIGFSLAALNVSIWYPCVLIGIITALLSVLGISLGNRFGSRIGPKMEVFGGIVLLFIGLKILISHLIN